ncbi:MAG: HIT domain-containing protein [Legionella sp.]|nr:MAG: HIT domain-containing protein [Legionella sp.]
MAFSVDPRIETTSFFLQDWPLSRVFLKNEQQYPWFILVPRTEKIHEIFQLDKDERSQLMEEIHHLSLLVQNFFKPDKLNIGALGNIVEQLHIHVVARRQQDSLWPQGIWQAAQSNIPYTEDYLEHFLPAMKALVSGKLKNE